MFRNYLTVALRRFRRGGTHAAVNVAGLALGMATCSLIFLLVFHEWSYDRFHENRDLIHRVHLDYLSPEGEPGVQSMMTPTFTPSLAATFPAIEKSTRLVTGQFDFTVGDESSRHRLAEIDADFFEMFSFDVLAGDAVRSIANPTSMVISTKAATAMFGIDSNDWSSVLGRVVTIPDGGEEFDFTVGAIIAAMPDNSSINFDVAISFENYDPIQVGGNNYGGRTSTYVQLADGASAAELIEAFPPFTATEFARYIAGMQGADQMGDKEGDFALSMQPLASVHSNMVVWLPYETNAHNPLYSYVLTGIGLLILLIACINFMTLSVGQSTIRAREVGVRKVLGASRQQVMRQHWGESIVLAAVSLSIGLGLALAALPAFNNLVGTSLSLSIMSPILIFFALAGLVLVVGVVAGSYPALVLSRYLPAKVLKGAAESPRNNWLTRSLVVMQFTISIGLIVSTGIMSSQLTYMLDKDLGFEEELVLAVNAGQVARTDADGLINYFRDQLLPYEEITHISRSGYSFTRGSDRNGWSDANGTPRQAYNFGVGYDWIDLLGMEIVEGRNFSRDRPSDATTGILVNEALVREFELENPVGHVMTNWLSFVYEESPTVIGVVKDYHFQSLHNDVLPAIMNMHPDYYSYMGALLVKVAPDNVSETIGRIETAWNEILPGRPFEYSFVDDDLATQYVAEERWQSIVTYSSMLAILIACLGLFGLAVLTVDRRTKEIGVRKVLGASVLGVTTLLSREFAVLVAIASLIASPIAYVVMTAWLDGFAFQVAVGPMIFVVASLLTLAIALGTVSYHSIRAASANPVRALRYE